MLRKERAYYSVEREERDAQILILAALLTIRRIQDPVLEVRFSPITIQELILHT